MRNNWDLKLTATVEADEVEVLVQSLRAIARRIGRGEKMGEANECAGIYEFSLESEEKPHPPLTDEALAGKIQRKILELNTLLRQASRQRIVTEVEVLPFQ